MIVIDKCKIIDFCRIQHLYLMNITGHIWEFSTDLQLYTWVGVVL